MSKVMEGLYIGCALDANKRSMMKKLGVTHILNVASELPAFHSLDFVYKKIIAYDVEHFYFYPYFDEIADFINEGRKMGGVLVHCMYGISRSTCSVITYLMKYEHLTFKRALALIEKSREFVYPNEGFVKQLRQYEKCLKNQREVDLGITNNKNEKAGILTGTDSSNNEIVTNSTQKSKTSLGHIKYGNRSMTLKQKKIRKPKFNLGIKSILDAMVSRSELMSTGNTAANLNLSNMSTNRSTKSERRLHKRAWFGDTLKKKPNNSITVSNKKNCLDDKSIKEGIYVGKKDESTVLDNTNTSNIISLGNKPTEKNSTSTDLPIDPKNILDTKNTNPQEKLEQKKQKKKAKKPKKSVEESSISYKDKKTIQSKKQKTVIASNECSHKVKSMNKTVDLTKSGLNQKIEESLKEIEHKSSSKDISKIEVFSELEIKVNLDTKSNEHNNETTQKCPKELISDLNKQETNESIDQGNITTGFHDIGASMDITNNVKALQERPKLIKSEKIIDIFDGKSSNKIELPLDTSSQIKKRKSVDRDNYLQETKSKKIRNPSIVDCSDKTMHMKYKLFNEIQRKNMEFKKNEPIKKNTKSFENKFSYSFSYGSKNIQGRANILNLKSKNTNVIKNKSPSANKDQKQADLYTKSDFKSFEHNEMYKTGIFDKKSQIDIRNSYNDKPVLTEYSLADKAAKLIKTREWMYFTSSVKNLNKNSIKPYYNNPSQKPISGTKKNLKSQNSMISLRANYLGTTGKTYQPSPANKKLHNTNSYFRCENCKFELFSSENIFYHQDPKNEKMLCNSYFIEKKDWMNFDARNASFKLHCPQCLKVLGECKIGGLMCSCGFWQVPAFKLCKTKVQEFFKSLNQIEDEKEVILSTVSEVKL